MGVCRDVARGVVRTGCHLFGCDTHARFKKLKLYKNLKKYEKPVRVCIQIEKFFHMNFENLDCAARTDVRSLTTNVLMQQSNVGRTPSTQRELLNQHISTEGRQMSSCYTALCAHSKQREQHSTPGIPQKYRNSYLLCVTTVLFSLLYSFVTDMFCESIVIRLNHRQC